MGWFDWLTGGEVQERQSAPAFKEQAFLMYNIKKIAPIHNQNYESYQKLTLLKGGASQVVNRILNADYFIKRPMMDLTPAEISELVPRLRLYKQEFKNDGTFEIEIEIKFPNESYSIIKHTDNDSRVTKITDTKLNKHTQFLVFNKALPNEEKLYVSIAFRLINDKTTKIDKIRAMRNSRGGSVVVLAMSQV
jgi:hypothetical protein